MGWIAENAVCASISMYCIMDQDDINGKVTTLYIRVAYGIATDHHKITQPQAKLSTPHSHMPPARFARSPTRHDRTCPQSPRTHEHARLGPRERARSASAGTPTGVVPPCPNEIGSQRFMLKFKTSWASSNVL